MDPLFAGVAAVVIAFGVGYLIGSRDRQRASAPSATWTWSTNFATTRYPASSPKPTHLAQPKETPE